MNWEARAVPLFGVEYFTSRYSNFLPSNSPSMYLHLTLSTSSKAADRPWDWQTAAMLVDFLYGGRSGSIEQLIAEIGNHFNNDAQSLTIVELKPGKRSGRYRQKLTVPI